MFCRNCGCKNDDTAIFCRECGSKLVVDANEQVNPNSTPIIVPMNTQQVSNGAGDILDVFKSIPKKILAGLGIGIVASVVIVFVLGNVNSTINLDEFVEISYEGYEGYGHASVSIEWAGLANKYGNKLKYTNAGVSAFGAYKPPVDVLEEYISAPSLDKSEGLSNGDELKCAWNIDEEELSKYIKCKVKFSDKSVKVSGLEVADTFDPFESLMVTFDGVGPVGYVIYEYTGDYLDTYDFYVDKKSGLSNGDTITISIDNADPKYFASNYGKIPAITEKEYSVEGLGTYASKVDEIGVESLNSIKTKVESIITDYTSGWSHDATVDSVSYIGNYVAHAKDSDADNYNYLGIVYQINSHVQAASDCDVVNVVQYFDVVFKNVAVKADGTVDIDLGSYSPPRNSFYKKAYYGKYSFNYRNYTYYGYESLPALVKNRSSDFGDGYEYDWEIEGLDLENMSAKNEEYICPYSSEREMTREEIDAYMSGDYSAYSFPGDRTIVQMLINEIYAKHGYQFSDDELIQYFNEKEWYTSISDKTNDMDEIYKSMSSVEQANVKLLQEYQ